MNTIFTLFGLILIHVPLPVVKYMRFKDPSKLFNPVFRDFLIDDVSGYYTNDFDDQILTNNNGNYYEFEVKNCMRAALAYNASGRPKKALKLIEHAAAISPEIPISNRYGEYLQFHVDVTFDELYYKALTFTKFGKSTRNTTDFVHQLDRLIFKKIDNKRELLQRQTKMQNGYDIVKKVYFLHIFHMLGVRRSTMTLHQLQSFIETSEVIGGKTVAEHNVIMGLEAAFEYIKSLASVDMITLAEIFELHRSIMGHVDPGNSGVFRRRRDYVGGYVAPPVEDLPKLMEGYVKWLNSEEARGMHPVEYAALAHYKLVVIRPFPVGNGRTSRFLLNLILLRFGYPPVIINRDDWQKYYDYLRLANEGDVESFVRLIAYSTDETLNVYLGSIKLLFINKRRPKESSAAAHIVP